MQSEIPEPPKLNLPIVLEELTPEQVTWLASKSAQDGMSTAEVIHELLAAAAKDFPSFQKAA